MRRSVPGVRQHDITDCGAACLQSVARHHGLRMPIARIRQCASTGRRGTSVLGLVEAATALGFAARGVRAPFESLGTIPLPAVAHLVLPGSLQHYVVVAGVSRRHVRIMDPSDGRVRDLPHERFTEQWSGVLLVLVPGEEFRARNEQPSTIRRFWELLRPHRRVWLQAFCGAALYTVLALSTTIYVQKIVDGVLAGGDRNLLNLMSVAMLGIAVVLAYLGVAKSMLTMRTGQQIDARLILGYYRHLLRLPQPFFDGMRVGEIIARIGDAVKIRSFINDVALELVLSAMIVVLAYAMLFAYSVRLGALMLLMAPIYAIIYAVSNAVNRRDLRTVMERGADLEAQLVESLTAAGTIKRFGLEPLAEQRTEQRLVRLLRVVYHSAVASIWTGSATQLAGRLFVVVLLWAGADLALDQALTPGALMSCYALLGYLSAPLGSLVAANRAMQDALIAAERLFEVLDLECEQDDGPLALSPRLAGDVQFEDVGFRYGARAALFEHLTLCIPRGQVTAIVGESGSGKSTIAALLLRLYTPQEGRIRIGGTELRTFSRSSLRRRIAIVPQQVDLFTGDVIQNIAVGEEEPDLPRVIELAQRLGIAEWIQALPAGFHTQLGEHGQQLSAGQRQRIAIARALYRDPEILICDEATSALDPLSERVALQAIASLRAAGRTVLLIAHRLHTVAAADRIIVVRGGRAAECGTHADLLRRGGSYAELWWEQMGGPRGDGARVSPAVENGVSPMVENGAPAAADSGARALCFVDRASSGP